MAQRNRWFLLSLTLQVVAGALMVALAFGHRVPLTSALIPVLLLIASIALAGPAWRALLHRRESEYEAVLRYVRQRREAPDTRPPDMTDPAAARLVQAIAELSVAGDATHPSQADPTDALDVGNPLVSSLNEELRPPINAMMGALGRLADSALDLDQRQWVHNARHSAHELWSTVRDVFDYSELRARRLVRATAVFDVAAMIERVIEHWSPLARERGIELASFVDPAVPARVQGDAERVEQVLMQLIRHAIASTRQGGAVIGVRPDAVAGRVRFDVSDSGAGLDEDALALWRADVAGRNVVEAGGIDVGLPLARRLVDWLGGELRFDSRAGDGTRFEFSLALADAGSMPEEWFSRRAELEGARCLLVDDNRSSLLAIREQLRAWRVEVDTVEDGARAVRTLQDAVRTERPYDLAIVDLSLPDLDGTELANRIRAIKDFSTLTLVSMVGDRDAGAGLQLHDKGFDAFLVKPVRQRSMAHWLVEALQRQSLVAKTASPRATDRAPDGARLLLVEDSPPNRIVASTMLTRAGYHVDTAENGAEAVEKVRAEDWNLVLMDLQMPVMDGLTATRAIRKLDGRRGQVPIIAVTANVFPEDLQACADAGMAEVVAKPIKRDDLLAAVARWLRHDEDEAALLDTAAIAALIQRLGEAGAGRVLKVFLDESARRIARIGEQLAQTRQRQDEVRKLRQAAESFGVRGLIEACERLSDEPRAADVEGLNAVLDDVRAALKARLGKALG